MRVIFKFYESNFNITCHDFHRVFNVSVLFVAFVFICLRYVPMMNIPLAARCRGPREASGGFVDALRRPCAEALRKPC